MTDNATVSTASHLLQNKGDGALFLIGIVFVLLVALVGQVLFLNWRDWFPGAESETSLFKSVRAGVYTFMSHLN
jgi:light-harvesting complex 1 beta chain